MSNRTTTAMAKNNARGKPSARSSGCAMRMTKFSRRLLATAASLAAAGALPQAALAQDEPAPAEEPAEEDSGTILVTAQKREQVLSDVSLSVSAVGAEQLAATNTYSI